MLFPRLRRRQLERIFKDRYGSRSLPDDDAGRADLRLMADHLAQLGKKYIEAWASLWAPWLSDEATDALIEEVGAGKYWTADALAEELNLDDATCRRLSTTTIGAVDCPKAQRIERRNKHRNRRKAAKRKAERAALRAQTKPWLAFGKSKRWWFAHGKPGPPDRAQNMAPQHAVSMLGGQVCARGLVAGARGYTTGAPPHGAS